MYHHCGYLLFGEIGHRNHGAEGVKIVDRR